MFLELFCIFLKLFSNKKFKKKSPLDIMAHLISIAVEQVAEWVLCWAARAWVHLCCLQAEWLCGHSLCMALWALSLYGSVGTLFLWISEASRVK